MDQEAPSQQGVGESQATGQGISPMETDNIEERIHINYRL